MISKYFSIPLHDPTLISMIFLNLFYIYSPTYFFVVTIFLLELNSILTSKFNPLQCDPSPSILDLPQYFYYKIYKKFIKDELTNMEQLIFYIVVFTVSIKMSTKTLLLTTANFSLFVKRNYPVLMEFVGSMKNYGKITYQQMKEIDQKCGSILSSGQSFLMETCSPMRPSLNKSLEPCERISLSTIARINNNKNNFSEPEDEPINEFEQKNKVLFTSDLELEIPNLEDTLEGQVSYIFGEDSLFKKGIHDDSVVGKLNSSRLKSYSARALNLMSSLDTTIESNCSTDDSYDPDYIPPPRPRSRLQTVDLSHPSTENVKARKNKLQRRYTYASPAQEIIKPVSRRRKNRRKILEEL